MTPACFSIFVKKVHLHTEIVPSKHVTVEEKLAMLLYWLRGAKSYRKIDEVFQSSAFLLTPSLSASTRAPSYLRRSHLPETLGLLVHSDLRKLYVVQPTADTPTSSVITDKPRFVRYFGNCIGAIDGTHALYKTQDILAAMTFDLRFCYLQTGCEGSAHDQQAWDWARERDLLIPEGKY
ncbi:BQ5605_C017g08545 [Microbotryum silenes-dioicae]|uniref:BQ5605_C017g08545 protein n=1 Tax=Microbotryum silenes-dioicae TaxID=796604 RepID=A0A2X0LYZ6_9BASI|nr:BQ5605_C017g08545 [Microbotryum silenes-dioicae]